MAIRITHKQHPDQPKKRRSGHTKPQAPLIPLDQPGRLRVAHLQALLGDLSHSAFYQRRKMKQVPPPDGYDGRRPYWNTATVRAFLQR